jgi:hypothetical protein
MKWTLVRSKCLWRSSMSTVGIAVNRTYNDEKLLSAQSAVVCNCLEERVPTHVCRVVPD